MNLAAQLIGNKDQNLGLSLSARAETACRLAKQLEKAGDYGAAREALNEFWPERHNPPKVDGLDEPTKGEVLLRVGALAGWLESADQTDGNQEAAKNFLTESGEIFHQLSDATKEAEVHGELGLCYWREGSYDEARVQLRAALHLLAAGNDQQRAILLIRAGIVEVWAQRLNEALDFYNQAAPLVEQSPDPALKGTLHSDRGIVYRRLAASENREDYLDRALIEYTAASFHFERAGNERYLARVENNLGFLYFTLGQYDDAHQHLDRARDIFLQLKDIGTAAQVDETRARTLLAQGRLVEAERIVRSAIKTLEHGGQQAVLAEALTTHGTILARLGKYPRARALLQRACEIAETAGDLEGAGRANLSLIEELSGQTPAKELVSIYHSAVQLLENTQDPSSRKRLMSCANRVIDTLTPSEVANQESPPDTWEDFSLKRHIHNCERLVIEQALRDAGGAVTRAARLLGFKHHHSLISLLNTRHQELLKSRSAARKRRHPLISAPGKTKSANGPVDSNAEEAESQLVVLHVEDHKSVGDSIKDTLAEEGMRVASCPDGLAALELLKSTARYDVIIVDNDLPGLGGLELVLRARSLSHRRKTPVIMLSGDDCEKEAWRAGVNAFLLKPRGVDKVVSTFNRLLTTRETKRK